jgi:hypothetical protein
VNVTAGDDFDGVKKKLFRLKFFAFFLLLTVIALTIALIWTSTERNKDLGHSRKFCDVTLL